MADVSISIPDRLRPFIEEQVLRGGYGDVSAYLIALVRDDQQRKARANVEAKLLEGLDSGDAEPMTDEDWADIERQVRQPHKQRTNHRRDAEDAEKARLPNPPSASSASPR
jgi:antitoxin ParD1/3/4